MRERVCLCICGACVCRHNNEKIWTRDKIAEIEIFIPKIELFPNYFFHHIVWINYILHTQKDAILNESRTHSS